MEIKPDLSALIDEIKNDCSHGAGELALQAAGVIKTAAEQSQAGNITLFKEELKVTGEQLMSVRPAMAPVYNIVNRLLDIISNNTQADDIETLRQFAVSQAERSIQDLLQAINQVVRQASALIPQDDVIVTHSYSSTVMAVFIEASKTTSGLEVIMPMTGMGQLEVDTVNRLAAAGIKVTLIDVSLIAIGMNKCSKVMVGADRICADGALVNAAGTFPLAKMAHEAGKPFYVLCDTSKFDTRLKGDEVDLEDKIPTEMFLPGVLPPLIWSRRPTFDVTPFDLISGVVTENGVLNTQDIVPYLKRLLA
jgi:ribose 1,5-bisphosphate isomerase